jgi:hypothetical protein
MGENSPNLVTLVCSAITEPYVDSICKYYKVLQKHLNMTQFGSQSYNF